MRKKEATRITPKLQRREVRTGTRSARNCGASKDLPWHAVRKARERELKYLRDLGVYEKVDENEAGAQYQVTPVDRKWVDTDKAFEGEPMHIRSRIVARKFKSNDRPDLHAGTPPLEALKAIISIAANHKETFSIMHIDVSRAHFHAEAQRLVLVRLPVTPTQGDQDTAAEFLLSAIASPVPIFRLDKIQPVS